MSRPRERKQQWFDNGKGAFERVTGRSVRGYVCPICVRACETLEDVTLEHAPPSSMGGRIVCLTCDECNVTSGHRLDNELAAAVTVRALQRGTLGRPLRARSEFAGVPLNVDVDWTPGLVTVCGVPAHNDPSNTTAQREALDRFADSGDPDWAFKLWLPMWDEPRARIALLRAAYLVAFAALGYRYVLREELEIVREQILNPDDALIERFSLHFERTKYVRGIVRVTRPRALECILVQMNEHVVFLPGLKPGSNGIYDRLAARKLWPPRSRTFRHLAWQPVVWPTRPVLTLDRP